MPKVTELGIVLCAACVFLAAVNIVTFILFGADKLKAIRGSWRISEKALLIWCAAFGAAGGLLGMFCFRHKTKKLKFLITVPTMLVIQILAVALVILLAK